MKTIIKEIDNLELDKTLIVVSSKTGITLETQILMEYFLELAGKRESSEVVGDRFIAITDPGSPLEQTARRLGFRQVFHGSSDIGGRYAALSDFGMVSSSARYTSVGFGSIQQRIFERTREESFQYDAEASINVDKFLPSKSGIYKFLDSKKEVLLGI